MAMGEDDRSSYAYSIAPADHWDLRDVVALIDVEHKAVGSTEGHAVADTSPLQAARVATATDRLTQARSAVLALAVIMLGIGLAVSLRSDRSMVEERLDRYVEPEQPKEKGKGPQTNPLTDWINRRVERSSLGDTISKIIIPNSIRIPHTNATPQLGHRSGDCASLTASASHFGHASTPFSIFSPHLGQVCMACRNVADCHPRRLNPAHFRGRY